MTMIPVYKKCKLCGTVYSWNPDVGHWNCPNCRGLSSLAGKYRYQKLVNGIKAVLHISDEKEIKNHDKGKK